ncbi:MAG: geranylgeranylglycerol-phosphate geranylgeranyltransferase [Flavobacteriales bacterium]|nr:geranylgeranylglycerol-phosphate geranylgeranyltransferase [Flavobacteriales bacterium]
MNALKIFRPLNLAIIGLLQVLTFRFLDFESGYAFLTNPILWKLVASSIAISAAGYLFNDMLDTKTDSINKPEKMYIRFWNIKLAWLSFVLLNAFGLLLSNSINGSVFFIMFSVVNLMMIYSLWFKRWPFVGNLLVALFAGISIFVVYVAFLSQYPLGNISEEMPQYNQLIRYYAGFAFFITLIREMIKDLEDYQGDHETGAKTLPIVLGITTTRNLTLVLSVFILVVFAQINIYWFVPSFFQPLKWVVIGYQIVCVGVPLAAFCFNLSNARSTENFSFLSQLIKYVMITGFLSMLFL